MRLNGFVPSVRDQIEAARARARGAPADAEASGRFGMVLHAYDQFEPAIVCYRRAQILDPKSHRGLYYLGTSRASAGKPAESSRWLQAAAKRNPSYIPGRLALAEAWMESGQAARQLAEQCARDAPDSARVHLVLGRILSAAGDHAASLQQLQKACALAPKNPAAHYALALEERSLGMTAEAEKELALHEQYRPLHPPSEDPLMDEVRGLNHSPFTESRRAVDLINQDRLFEALEQFAAAIRSDPNYQPAYAGMIALCSRLGLAGRGERIYRDAIALHPEFFEVYLNYALLELANSRYAEAEAAFRKVLEHDPNQLEANVQYGRLLEKTGRAARADRYYRTALEQNPNHRQANYLLGQRLLAAGRVADAIPLMEKAARGKDEGTPWYLRVLAVAYARARRRQEAAETALEALRQARLQGQNDLAALVGRDLQKINAGGIP